MRDEYDFSGGKRGPVLKRPPQGGGDSVDLPVVCTLTPATIATRKPAYKRGFAMQAPLAMIGFIAGVFAWWQSDDWRWLLGAVLPAARRADRPSAATADFTDR